MKITVTVVIVICFLSSCTSDKVLFFNSVRVKNYPVDTPFVYNNIINIKGNISKDEKTRLQENLIGFWADSLFARRVEKFGVFYNLKNPPVFDTTTLSITHNFMNGYLFSEGYFNAVLKDTFYIDTFQKDNQPAQYRTTVIMNILPQKRVIIDSLGYNLKDTSLQTIASHFSKASLIQPGKTPYSKELLTAELDRLVTLYRQRGYYLLQRENLAAVVDTVNTALLKLTLDPFAQAELIEQAAEKKTKNPTASVSILQRRFADTTVNFNDTAFLKKFYIREINYYPEVKITDLPDSIIKHKDAFKNWSNKNYNVFYNRGMFNPYIFRHYNYLYKNRLYNDALFYKTVNTYGQIGAWRQVDTRINIINDSLDINYFLYPERKQNITYNLEASRNTGDILTASDFFGLALNIIYKNRNVFRQAIQSSTSFTNGVELSFNKQQTNSLLQAFQVSLGQTYSLPRAFVPFRIHRSGRFDFGRTIISANASYSDRQDYFKIRSLVADYGYDWKVKNKVWQFRFPNIELYSLDTLPKLRDAFISNPFLRNSFNNGYVISAQSNLSITYAGKRNITNYASFSIEESGLPGLKSKNSRIYQYIKVAAEARKSIPLARTSLAFRAFAGIGYNYNSSGRFGSTLPFFKQFIAGGPNSMRAWGLRQLGLGSSLLSDTARLFRDRYGDMQLEANTEYRYPIAHFTSVNVNGAFFADAGNIWNARKDPDNPKGTFDFNRLGHDVALGVGTGFRFDFHYFLIRIDMGLKVKDPARIENNGWIDIKNFSWRNHEYDKFDAVTGKLISPKRNNYAVQLGIGLPF